MRERSRWHWINAKKGGKETTEMFATAKLLLELLRLLESPSIACTNVGMKLDVVARPVPHKRLPATVTRGSESTVRNERLREKKMTHVRKLRENCIRLL